MMHAWLIYDREGAERNRDYIEYHHEVGARYDVTFRLLYAEGAQQNHLGGCEHPDFAIVRTIHPEINAALEANGIPTYNNSKVSRITNHKYHCIEYIKQNTTVPTIPTTLLTVPTTDAHPGDVIKPVAGHGGAGVMRVPADGLSEEDTKKIRRQGDYILQPYIDGPGEDVRVYVIGDRIIAAVRRHAAGGDFRANASLGGNISRYNLNKTETDYVNQIIQSFDFGMVGIDFIIDKNNHFIFNEIEDVVGSRMLYKTHPEIDILDNYIHYITTNITSN